MASALEDAKYALGKGYAPDYLIAMDLVEALELALHAIRQLPVGIEDFAGERFYEICLGAEEE